MYSKKFRIIWADIDANRHMRHSAYNDYAAQVRVDFFHDNGFPVEKFGQMQIGPILFREETIFFKEINMNETITVDIALLSARKDASRWKIEHTISKENGAKAAVITVEGAWMDLLKRKLTVPPEEVLHMLEHLPKAEKYEDWPDKK